MAGSAFDTLTAARRLKKVGMEEAQAEAIAESLRDAVTGSVATKQDLDAAKAELREEITAFKAEVREEITAFKAEVREEIAALKTEFREEIASVKAEATAHRAETRALKWLMAFLVGLTVMMVGRMFAIF